MLNALDLQSRLAEKGLKSTPQRMLIYRSVAEAETHPSAEEVHERLHTEHPSISLGTVYKTLELLVQHELLCRVPVTEGRMRYDACTHAHGHIYCRNTGEILDYNDPELESLIKAYLAKKKIENLNIGRISLHIEGSKPRPDAPLSFE